MTHLDLAKELNTFSFECDKMPASSFGINEETQKRVVLSRLYYALFNRILADLPKLAMSRGSNKHESVGNILAKQAGNSDFYRNLYDLFKDLKTFREWADYKFTANIPLRGNFAMLFRKVYSYINATKVIA